MSREVYIDKGGGGNNNGNNTTIRQPYQKPRNIIYHQEPILPDHIATIKTIIIKLCDYSTQSLEDRESMASNITAVADMLVSAGDIISEPVEVGKIFITAMKCLSMQGTIVSTLLAVIFRLNNNFPTSVISELSKELLESLSNDNVLVSKLILRSMAALCCSNCLTFSGSDGFLDIIDSLLTIAENHVMFNDVAVAGYLTPQGEVATYLVSNTVCWCSTLFNPDDEKANNIKKRILAVCRNVNARRTSPFDVGGKQAIFQVMNFSDECVNLSPGPDNVMSWDTLWDSCSMAIYALENQLQPSEIECMVMPWLKLEDELNQEIAYPTLTFDPSIKDTILALNDENKIGAKSRLSMPDGSPIGTGSSLWLRPRFAIFESDSGAQLPGNPLEYLCTSLTPFQRQVAASYYHDILHFFEPINRDDGALIGYSAKRERDDDETLYEKPFRMICSQLDYVSCVFPGDAKMQFLLVEVLFQLMMQQPISLLKNALLNKLLLVFCRKNDAFPIVIALCSTIMFGRIQEMDTSCWRQLARWYSFHLGNTKFSWNWQYWESEFNEAEEGDPVRLFCHYFIDKCSRTYLPNQNVSTKFPIPAFVALGAINMQPSCPLYSGTVSESLSKLRTMIERPIEHQIDEIEAWIESNADIDIRAILQAIFVVASLSTLSTQSLPPTSMDSSFDRFSNIIGDYTDTDENQMLIMQILVEIWGHDGAMLHCLLEKFLRRAFLKVTTLSQWIVTRLHTLTIDPHIYSHTELVIDVTLDIIRAALHHRRQLGDVVITDILDSANIVSKENSGDKQGGDMDDEDPTEVADQILHNAWHSSRSVYKNIVGALLVAIVDIYQKREKDDESIDPWITSATSLLQRVLRSYSGLQKHISTITNESLGDDQHIQTRINAIKLKSSTELYPIEIVWKSYL